MGIGPRPFFWMKVGGNSRGKCPWGDAQSSDLCRRREIRIQFEADIHFFVEVNSREIQC
jgi:hypothetical protein